MAQKDGTDVMIVTLAPCLWPLPLIMQGRGPTNETCPKLQPKKTGMAVLAINKVAKGVLCAVHYYQD